jgi:hypothetical protein
MKFFENFVSHKPEDGQMHSSFGIKKTRNIEHDVSLLSQYMQYVLH